MNAKKKTASEYKLKLIVVSEMKAQSKGLLYDRVKILNEVFDDRDFRAEAGNLDDFKADEHLSAYVDDTGFTFLQLRAILEHFPNRAAWEKRKLAEMYDEMRDAKAKLNKQERQPTAPRRRVTAAEFDQAQEEKSRAQVIAQQSREQLHKVTDEADALRAEVARLQGRISELERENRWLRRQLKKHGAAAEPATA